MASPEAQAVLDRMSALTVNEAFAIEQFVDTLVASGDWTNMYDCWSFAINSTDYLTGWIGQNWTVNGSTTHVAGTGITFNATNAYLSALFSPSDLETWNATGASMGGWCTSATSSGSNADYGGSVSGGGADYYIRNRTANDLQAILGSSVATPRLTPVTYPFADFFFARSDATTRYIRVGDATTSGAQTLSTGWAADPFVFPGRNSSGQQNGFISTWDWYFIGNENLDDDNVKAAIEQFRLDLVSGPPLIPPSIGGVQRPDRFRLVPGHPLGTECLFAGLGSLSGSNVYFDSTVLQNDGIGTDKPPWITGIGRRGIETDGISQRVLATVTQAAGLTAATLSGWIYRSATSIPVGFGFPEDQQRLFIQWFTDGNLYVVCEDGIGEYGEYGVIANADIGWHHVSVVFDGTQSGNNNRLKLYWDGEYQAWDAVSGTFGATLGQGTTVSLGWEELSGDVRYWAGSYADIILHATAFTDGIKRLANPDDPMLDGWIEPLPTTTYYIPRAEPPTPVPTRVVYHPTRKFSQRPDRFRLAPDHPYGEGVLFASLGLHAHEDSRHYLDSGPYAINGTPTRITNPFWKQGDIGRQVGTFTTAREHFVLENTPPLRLPPSDTEGRMLSCWVRIRSQPTQVVGVASFTSGGTPGWWLTNGGTRSLLLLGASKYTYYADGWSLVSDGEWHHVAAWMPPLLAPITDSAWYVDGVPLNQSGITDSGPANPSLGSYILFDIPSATLDGELADVILWNRQSSYEQVKALTNPSDPMLDGWVQPLPTKTYFIPPAKPPIPSRKSSIFKSRIIRGTVQC